MNMYLRGSLYSTSLSTVIILNNRHYGRLCRKDFLTRGREVMVQNDDDKIIRQTRISRMNLPRRREESIPGEKKVPVLP